LEVLGTLSQLLAVMDELELRRDDIATAIEMRGSLIPKVEEILDGLVRLVESGLA
jgi:hypothetical protein